MRLGWIAIIVVPLLAGCTNRQLARSMVAQASTVMDIEYQMVLDNIAMFKCNPSALPWHVRINDGVVQVNDQAGLDSLGIQWGTNSNFTRGPRAMRSVTEQWGADAVTNPRIVKKLQDVYRQAIGLPPEPDPIFFAATLHSHAEASNSRREDAKGQAADPEELPPGKRVASKDGMRDEPIDWPDFEVPAGWFHVGRKCDVPKNACYVGQHGDCYVWVTRNGLPDLSRFSLVILAITNSQTRDIAANQLEFTR
jgi:hypothetical protein